MQNEKIREHNFVPFLNSHYRILGFIILTLNIILLSLDLLFAISLIKFDYNLIIGNFSLLMINFSLDKKNLNGQIIHLYHSLKFSFIALQSTLLSFYIVAELFGISKDFNILSILFVFNILLTLHYYFIRKINLTSEIETTILKNIKSFPKLFLLSFTFSIITIIIILIIVK